MARLIAPVKLACLLALALAGGASAGGAWASRPPLKGTRARAAIIGGTPVSSAPAASSVPATSDTPVGSGDASAALASVVEVLDLRGRLAGQCTGTVVAQSLVLTAGHCAESLRTGVVDPAAGFRVLIGSGAPAGEGQLARVSAVIVYERFRRRVDDGDAALLVLTKPTTAPAIKLATSARELGVGSTATIAGWGNTFYGQRAPTESLRSAETVVQTPRWCARNAPPFFAASEICTIDPPRYATGACNGDSGGPLLALPGTGGEPVQIGIAVHVYDRCSTRRPSVFTSVAAIAPWVRSWSAAYRSAAPPPAGPASAPDAGL
jgi:secreted trypsin-like serine protease